MLAIISLSEVVSRATGSALGQVFQGAPGTLRQLIAGHTNLVDGKVGIIDFEGRAKRAGKAVSDIGAVGGSALSSTQRESIDTTGALGEILNVTRCTGILTR